MLSALKLLRAAKHLQAYADWSDGDAAEVNVYEIRALARALEREVDAAAGHSTPETYHVVLVLDNDEGIYERRRRLVRIVRGHGGSVSAVADALKNFCEDLCGLAIDEPGYKPPMLTRELLGVALANVDWMALAKTYVEEDLEDLPDMGPALELRATDDPAYDEAERQEVERND